MPKKRLDYLDMAKGVGIFLVVLGHIEYLSESTMRWIFSFHMPLFFVIGGILSSTFAGKEAMPFRENIRKRAGGTLTPYASFSIMILTMHLFEFFFQPERISERELARELVDSITGYGLHTLWFLPVYFLSGTLFYLFRCSFGGKRYGSVGIGICILALDVLAFCLIYGLRLDQYPVLERELLWHAGMNLLVLLMRVLIVLPFFFLGRCYAGLIKGKRDGRKALHAGAGALLFAVGAYASQQSSILDLHYLYIYPIHYLTASVSCIGLLELMRVLPASRILSYLGQNSLVIMCTHGPMYMLYYVSLGMFFVRKLIPMTDSVLYGWIAVAACAAEVPVIWIFNRYFSYLLGRKSKKS